MDNKTNKIFLAIILIVIGVSCRLLPHAWNVAPVAGIALFAGVYLGPVYAITLPVLTMLAGDFFLGFYGRELMLTVYGCYMIIGLMGSALKKYKSAGMIFSGSIISSVLFFMITNWAAWQFSAWYAPNLNGLIECYAMAIPFFRNTIFGDLFYVTIFFGAYEMASYALRGRYLCFKMANFK